LDDILDYIKHDPPQNAAATFDQLWQACQNLSSLPHR